jgi:hypothetical protein
LFCGLILILSVAGFAFVMGFDDVAHLRLGTVLLCLAAGMATVLGLVVFR